MNVKMLRIAALVAILVWNRSAHAEDPAAADAIFKAAVAAQKQGDWSTACAAFTESQRLDPRPGTQHAMAECEAGAGRIATAVTLYDDFLRSVAGLKNVKDQLRYLDRVKQSQKKKEALLKEVPTLVMVLPIGAPAYVRMTRNGEPFTTTSLGVPIPVNPGNHTITVQIASGYMTEQSITIERATKRLIELQLPRESDPKSTQASVVTPLGGSTAAPRKEGPRTSAILPLEKAGASVAPVEDGSVDSQRKRVRTAGVIVGGVGLAGLVTGIIAGGVILRRKGIIEENCVNRICNDSGWQAAQGLGALNATNAAALSFGGAAAIAGGLMIGWGNQWFGKGEQKPNLQMGAVVTGKNDVFLGLKGAF